MYIYNTNTTTILESIYFLMIQMTWKKYEGVQLATKKVNTFLTHSAVLQYEEIFQLYPQSKFHRAFSITEPACARNYTEFTVCIYLQKNKNIDALFTTE